MWDFTFITEKEWTDNVRSTIERYGDKLLPFNTEKFNKNIIDPIKMIFDKTVYDVSWEEIISNEVFRQRDKANNNDIGYFHQNIFSYIKGCEVPDKGWDVICKNKDGFEMPSGDIVKTIYVEMKNKHNTMNSASSAKTYMKMQNQILEDDNCACFLVEAIAKKSQNIIWGASVDGKSLKHKSIRRVSLDKFYEIVTGKSDAFYKLCNLLPSTITSVLKGSSVIASPEDTVFAELQKRALHEDISFEMSMLFLGFETYLGFDRSASL
jgi:hypothetical protein